MLIDPTTGDVINPTKHHGPCQPWCSVDDLSIIPPAVAGAGDKQCDTGSCLTLIEKMNAASATVNEEGEVTTEGTAGDEAFEHFAHTASSILYRLSGQQFRGMCTSRIYYCNGEVCCGWMTGAEPTYKWDPTRDAWINCWGPDSCKVDEGCNLGDRLRLPYSPLVKINKVTIPAVWDGASPLVELDPITGQPKLDSAGDEIPLLKSDGTAYLVGEVYPQVVPLSDLKIVDECDLVFCDGRAWPCPPPDACQDPPALCVEFMHGWSPPPEGVMAACYLACELMKFHGTGKCKLPARFTSVPTGNYNTQVVDRMRFLDQGRTGMYLPDLFLSTWNPHGLSQPNDVYWPTVNKGRGRTPFSVRDSW